jgi:UDP-glucose 4-epimerase
MGDIGDTYTLEIAIKMTKVLVTGGCGFIGSNLCSYLLEKGCEIKIIDDLSNSDCQNLPDNKNLDIVVKDIRIKLPKYDADVVVHLAAKTSVIESGYNPLGTLGVNVNGIVNVLEYCRLNNINHFIFASSSAVEGNSIYGISKLIGEKLCSAYFHNYGIKTTILRFSNVYGKYSKGGVIHEFINAVKHDNPIVIYGDGKQTRDFVHVNDICQAIFNSFDAKYNVYEIGTGVQTSINELVEILKSVSKRNIEVVYKPKRNAEIMYSFADILMAKEYLSYSPSISLRNGIESLWNG